MRYVFGLVGLLVCVAILMKLFADSAGPVTKAGAKAQTEARQMAGRDEATGESAADALTLEPAQRGGKTVGMTVKSVAAGSAMQKFYGLQANDVITQAGDMPLAEPFGGDVALASGMILEAYKASKPLAVQRGAERLSLPQSNPPAPAPPTPGNGTAVDPLAAPTAAPPASNPPPPQGGLNKQLDLIRSQGGQ